MNSLWQDLADELQAQSEQRQAYNPYIPDVSLPISDVVTYQTLNITEVLPGARDISEFDEPLDLLGDENEGHATGPAIGVVLHIEQAWRETGLGIGRLQHSLCLAPGEVTQVAMQGWSRGTKGNTHEVIGEQEAASQAADRTRDTSDVTRGVAKELQSGSSLGFGLSNHTSGATGGLVSAFVVAGSGAFSASQASSASWSTGSRNAAIDSKQRVRQQTAQHASNVRSRSATVVTEVDRDEAEQFSSRVVANYNHMHALNLQYYEMLQTYELAAKPVRAERCIFLPMQSGPLDLLTLAERGAELAKIATDIGRHDLAQQLTHFAAPNHKDLSSLRKNWDLYTKLMRTGRDYSEQLGIPSDIPLSEATDWIQEVGSFGQRPSDQKIALLKQIQEIVSQLYQIMEEEPRISYGAQNNVRAFNDALGADRLRLLQQLWSKLDPATVEAMVAGYHLRDETIASTIDPNPIAIIGNYVGFRWNFSDDDDGKRRREAFEQRYIHDHADPAIDVHVMPVNGLFLEAVLGTANSAEKLDITRYWRWDDDTIPIQPTAIEQLKHRRHNERAVTQPGKLGDPSVRRQELGDFPGGPSHAATAAINQSMFRDMSGKDLVQGLLKTVSESSQQHMEATQTQAQEAIGAWLDHVEQTLPKALEAVGNGNIDPSNLGSLANAFGEGGEIDPEALLSIASEVGVLL